MFLKVPRSQQVDEGAKVTFTCELDSIQSGNKTAVKHNTVNLYLTERNEKRNFRLHTSFHLIHKYNFSINCTRTTLKGLTKQVVEYMSIVDTLLESI